jgi:hypothetical protein
MIRACSISTACLACLAMVLVASCGGGTGADTGGGKPSKIGIVRSFWGYWTEVGGTMGDSTEWYISADTVTAPGDISLALQSSTSSSIVLFGSGAQYKLTLKDSGIMTAAKSGAMGTTYLFKRNGADAAFKAQLKKDSQARAEASRAQAARGLVAAGGIKLTLTNLDNASNVIETTSDDEGAVAVPAEAVAGDTYTVSLGSGNTPLTVVTVSAPNADAGTIALPDSSGAVFKAYLQHENPAVYRYAGTVYGAPSVKGMYDGYDLIIRNCGPAIEGVTYAITGQGGLAVTATAESAGYKLTNTVPFKASDGIQFIPISVKLDDVTDFGGADYIEPAIHVRLSKGNSVWEDDVRLRFYREKRYVSFYSDHPIRGYFMNPEGVSTPYSSGTTASASSQVELPYRSSPYSAMIFPDLVSPYVNSGTGRVEHFYGARVSTGASASVDPIPLNSAAGQYAVIYTSGSTNYADGYLDSLTVSSEKRISAYKLNDSCEPNDTLSAAVKVYSGESFHGFLSYGDYDAFSIDFSKSDPVASAITKDNAYELFYTGVCNDGNGIGSGDCDGILEPGETAALALGFRTHLDLGSVTGSNRVIFLYTKVAHGEADDGLRFYSPSKEKNLDSNRFLKIDDDVGSFFTYYSASNASVKARDRMISAIVSVPSDTDLLADQNYFELVLTVNVGGGDASVYGSYRCQVPISR